jgi:hypothetical protein
MRKTFVWAVIATKIAVCGSVGLLWLVVGAICKCSMDPESKLKPRLETL